MRQSMRDRIARLERTIHQGEFVITFAPWLRAKLKAAPNRRGAPRSPPRRPTAPQARSLIPRSRRTCLAEAASLPLAAASLRLRGRPGRPRKHPLRPVLGEIAVTPNAPSRASSGDELRPLAIRTSGPRLLSARETAAYLAIGYETVLLLVKSGTLRPVRLPLGETALRKLLFDRVDLDRLVEVSKA
jgi:hypothetical protein